MIRHIEIDQRADQIKVAEKPGDKYQYFKSGDVHLTIRATTTRSDDDTPAQKAECAALDKIVDMVEDLINQRAVDRAEAKE